MHRDSLRKRFFTNTAIVAAVVMFVSMLVVDVAYRDELKKSARETLRLHVFTLLSVAQINKGVLTLPDILYNTRLNTSDSGLWAAVLDNNRETLWHSLSIDYLPDNINVGDEIGDWVFSDTKVGESTYYLAVYKIAWESDSERQTFYFIAAEDHSIINNVISRFRRWLFGSFLTITAALMLCQFIALRLTFRPITRLENEISLLEQGKKEGVSKDYPKELEGVTTNINSLITKEYRQRERYRTSMADLAHSLKTPMAIINGEMRQYKDNGVLQKAIERIDKSIEYQLRRAVISGHNLQSRGSNVGDVVESIIEAFSKIYQDSDVELIVEKDEDLVFLGDENDLTELLGNLIDNAFKHAKSIISVMIKKQADMLTIVIADDGPGLSDYDSKNIFKRGERLDNKGLGQGIGLAVVADIVESYNGEIKTGASKLGGAQFTLIFPNKGSLE